MSCTREVMTVFENVLLALKGIWSHKLRSVLTMLGIIIGIASIITIVSTIKGTNEQIKQNLIGQGTNTVEIALCKDDYEYDMSYSQIPDGVAVIKEETLDEIRNSDGVEDVSAYNKRMYSDGNVFYKNTSFSGSVYGIDENYFSVCGYGINCGRNFVSDDFENNRKVAVIDDKAKTALFQGKSPVGEIIEISGEPFTVIGVVSRSSKFKPVINSFNDYYMYTDMSSGMICVPMSTWPMIFKFDEPQSVVLKAVNTDSMASAGQNAADILTGSQILTSTGNFSYKSQDRLEQAKQLQDLSSATNRQLIWIAGISLLVGGIGVMNIMLVSVTERTAEIGLKKAIGAKRKRILRQFLTEAAVLTSLGGIIGVLAGVALSKIISGVMLTPMAISIPAILVAVLFSIVIGIVFGLIPAVKASKLNPIEALRRE